MDYKLSNAKEFHWAGELGVTADDLGLNRCNKCTSYDTRRGGRCPFKKNEIHILHPLGNEVASRVKSWREIKEEALKLRDFINAKKFEGHWEDAYAISHAQVSRNPKSYFVVNQKVIKKFGSQFVINCRILKKSELSLFPEGCMSFMYRDMKKIERWAHIRVLYWTPFLNLFLIPRIKKFKNIEAFICQHEIDHANGKNIYGI